MVQKYTYVDHPVHDRLYFAERRLSDLLALNGGDFAGAPGRERQAFLQEFFFHLCGAIDFLAQEVNNVRMLGLNDDQVSPSSVAKKLKQKKQDAQIRTLLEQLHPPVRLNKDPVPADLYSKDGSHYRIIVIRNFITHIRHSPVSVNVYVGSTRGASAHLFLDPRLPEPQRIMSTLPVLDELALFLELVRRKCDLVLTELGIPTS